MFLSTISSGERIVTTAWKKYDGEIAVAEDKRGKYEHRPRVIDDMMVQSVKDHVNSIDRVESHYTRKDSKKLYLNNITRLLDNKYWTKDETNQVMRWNQIREVKVNKNVYDRIEYKYDLGEEPKLLIVLRTGKRNSQRTRTHFELHQAYNDESIPIPYEKYRNLNSMCNSLAIPRKYHTF
ncbi:hypothetical protein SFRURICE_010698 [Spodoptera frugiperda]|nr:hypothetical protein SFRURICE_010698 [Spodoptera frugiperda]